MNKQIENNFKYHPPKEGQPEKYIVIRENAKELATLIDNQCSDPERSLWLLLSLKRLLCGQMPV
jgi:hypothetical protein